MLRAWKMRQGGWLLVLAALLLWHASKGGWAALTASGNPLYTLWLV